MARYLISYECPECGHSWTEIWSCACDSECPDCGCDDIEASDYEVLSSSDDDGQD